MAALLDISIVAGPVVVVLYVLAGLAVLLVLVRLYSGIAFFRVAASLSAGALFGWVLAWLTSDVWDLFGVSLSMVTRGWVVAVFAGIGLAINTLAGRGWRRGVAIAVIPLCLLAAAAGINADFGQYTTVRAALGFPLYGALDLGATALTASSVGATAGSIGTVTIPATVSGFDARPAIVYLPAAARTAHPPVLPVVVMLSGQPGTPADVFTAGKLDAILDTYATAHAGQTPIVVVPDQLGAADRNPMCVDSVLGNSASYLTVDVPAWIRSTFSVAASPAGWTLAGFSQGGTCSIQLGAAHPELFGTILDISGELVPRNGDAAHTIQTGFAGSATAYAAAAPAAVLAAHAPYSNLHIIFAVGAGDTRFLAWANTLDAAATMAGAGTDLIVSPGTAHDWHTVQFAWTTALPLIAARTGLVVTP